MTTALIGIGAFALSYVLTAHLTVWLMTRHLQPWTPSTGHAPIHPPTTEELR